MGPAMIRLDATTWVRIGAAMFVLGAIGATALQVHRAPVAPAPAVGPVGAVVDPLSADLERCRHFTPDSPPDEACERTWAQVRRRFLGLAPTADEARP
jgi:conjugative transfer region protein TrbK